MNPFHPIPNSTVSISATTTSANVALQKVPSGKFHLRIHNAGPSTIFFNRGPDSTIAATTSNMPVPSGAVEVITINNTDASPVNYVAAITASSTATVYFTLGWGV